MIEDVRAKRLNDLADQMDALLDYANATTGAGDTRIGDAVKTLADGYGQGGGWGDLDNVLPAFGKNAQIVFSHHEHFSLADFDFDTSASYATQRVLRAANSSAITTYNGCRSDKDYASWYRTTAKVSYLPNKPSGIGETLVAFTSDNVQFIATGENTYQSSGRENVLINGLKRAQFMRPDGKWRRGAYGLKTGNSDIMTVTSNANPTSLSIISCDISFVSHAWGLDARAVPYIDVNNTTIDIDYFIVETDRYNLINLLETAHNREFNIVEE